MKDLKDYREKELSLYIIANILVFLVVHQFISINTDDTIQAVEILSQVFVVTIFSVITFSFTLIVECLFTSGLKANLLYSQKSRGWKVHRRNGTSSDRKCLTTNSDGAIFVKFGYDNDNSKFLSVTID